MNPAETTQQRAQRIFVEIYALDRPDRTAALDRACGDNGKLRAAVEELLSLHDAPDPRALGSFESAATSVHASIPEAIGPYRVLEHLGRGGMGVVYKAEQHSPRREVALKVLQPGLVDDGALRRFAREAEVLGALEHPGIARIYDAGSCDFGFGQMPYFAMEIVHGPTIREFVEKNRPSPVEICLLVARVADAAQHAHERGFVHRDLKPANILVIEAGTGMDGPQPKILDFGIARTTDAAATLSTMRTDTGQLLGTLPYMSPEQLSGRHGEIGPCSDVYALGAVLYELLAGHVPLDLAGRPLTDVGRVVHDVEPTRLGEVDRALRGDLETIADKALAKEPKRRYASAQELADDLRRFARHEPIRARPQTALYQLRKFARRNKTLVGGVLATFTVLIVGIVTTFWFLLKANENARLAQRNEYVSNVVAAGTLIATDPVAAQKLIETAAPAHQGWEWSWLRARLDPVRRSFDVAGRSSGVSYRPDGGLLALAPAGEYLEVHDVEGSRVSCRIHAPGHQRAVLTGRGNRVVVVFPPPEKGGKRRVVIWDSDGTKVLDLSDERITTHELWPNTDGSLVAWRYRSQIPAVMEVPDGRIRVATEPNGHTSSSLGPRFTVDGNQLWSGYSLYDARTMRRLRFADPGRDERYLPRRWFGELSPSPNGRRLLGRQRQNTAFLWLADAETGALLHHFRGHRAGIQYARFTPDGTRVISISDDGTARVWETATGRQTAVFARGSAHQIAIRPDGREFAAIAGSQIRTYAVDTAGAAQRVLPHHPNAGSPPVGSSFVYALAFSHDGTMLATGDFLGTVRVFDTRSGELLAQAKALRHWCTEISFGPRDLRLDITTQVAYGYRQQPKTHIDLVTWRPEQVPYGAERLGHERWPNAPVTGGSFRARAHGKATVIETRSGAMQFELPGLALPALSPNDRCLARVVGRDIEVRELPGGSVVEKFSAHDGSVIHDLRFLKDGRLVTAGRNNTARIWMLDPVRQVGELGGHASYVYRLAVTDDGAQIGTASGDETARIWDTVPASTRAAELAEENALRSTLRPLLRDLVRTVGDPKLIAERLWANESTSPTGRRWLRRELMRLFAPRSDASVVDDAARERYGALVRAALAVRDSDRAQAMRYLERTDASLRGWEWKRLHNQLLASDEEFRIPRDPQQTDATFRPEPCVAFDSTGRAVCAWLDAGEIVISEVATGRPLGRISSSGPLRRPDLSPSARWLAAWDTDSGELLAYELRPDDAGSLSESLFAEPLRPRALRATDEHSALGADGNAATRVDGILWDYVWSPDERFFTWSRSSRLYCADLATGKIVDRHWTHYYRPPEPGFHPNGRHLWAYTALDAATLEPVEIPPCMDGRHLKAKHGLTAPVAHWLDGRRVAIISDRACVVLDTETDQILTLLEDTFDYPFSIISQDRRRLFLRDPKQWGVWDLATGRVVRTAPGFPQSPCFDRAGTRVAGAFPDRVRVYRLDAPTVGGRLDTLARLRNEMRTRVDAMLATDDDNAAVAKKLRNDVQLDDDRRFVALEYLLERTILDRLD